MTFPTSVREAPEHIHHIEAQQREIEAKEEIIRLQADEITRLGRANFGLSMEVATLRGTNRVFGGQRA
jgi:hypothetical protein